jgi:hypothetical protein
MLFCWVLPAPAFFFIICFGARAGCSAADSSQSLVDRLYPGLGADAGYWMLKSKFSSSTGD